MTTIIGEKVDLKIIDVLITIYERLDPENN